MSSGLFAVVAFLGGVLDVFDLKVLVEIDEILALWMGHDGVGVVGTDLRT